MRPLTLRRVLWSCALLAAVLLGIVLLALRLRGRKDAIPFGPALAVGGVVALFWGEAIARWYWP